MVSVGDPREIDTIYSFKKPWRKSNVDTTMRVFTEHVEKRFVNTDDGTGRPIPCNFSQWLQILAFDVVGELTFSHRFGFMESGSDIDGAMADLWNNSQKTALVTQIPWLENVWTNNPIRRYLRGDGTSPACGELIKEWQVNNRDMLSRFMKVEAKDETVPPYALTVWTGSNITAGTDSTAIFLRTFFYYLLHNQTTLDRLLVELNAEAAAGRLDDLAGFKQVYELPYLKACFNEAGRMHPPLGLPMERSPSGGGHCLWKGVEGSTVVRLRQLAAGEVALRAGEATKDGKGASYGELCLVTAIAIVLERTLPLEIYKIVPTLLRTCHFDLLDPEEGGDWNIYNRWFVTQRGFMVRVRKRVPGDTK
ncbi:hypothetical protein VTN77DRAFT_1450 [Rasamsonia byssochlamydoides]|uniref:uncharacterized protein n=1 Tax=Rasamsonia byssochlamydoides TaxID=89139 RepID=UPI0037438FDA